MKDYQVKKQVKNQVKKNNSESLEKTGLTKCKQRESFAKQLAKSWKTWSWRQSLLIHFLDLLQKKNKDVLQWLLEKNPWKSWPEGRRHLRRASSLQCMHLLHLSWSFLLNLGRNLKLGWTKHVTDLTVNDDNNKEQSWFRSWMKMSRTGMQRRKGCIELG